MKSTKLIISNDKQTVNLPSTTTLYSSGTTQANQGKPIVYHAVDDKLSIGEFPQSVSSVSLTLAQAQALRNARKVQAGVLYVITFPGGRFGIDIAVEGFTAGSFSDQGTLVVTNAGIPSSSVVIDWSTGSYKALVADGSIYPTSTHQVPTTSAVGQAIMGKADLVGGLVPASELPIDQDLSSNSQTRVPSVKAVAAAISGFTAGDTISGFTNDIGKFTIATDKGNFTADLNQATAPTLLGNQLLLDPEFNQAPNTGAWLVTYGWAMSNGETVATDGGYLYQDIIIPVSGDYQLDIKANSYQRGNLLALVNQSNGSGNPNITTTGTFSYTVYLTAGAFRFHLLGRDYYYGSLEYCRLQQVKPGASYGQDKFVHLSGTEKINGFKTFGNDITLANASITSTDGNVNVRGQFRVDNTGKRDVLYFKGGPGGGGSTASIAFDATGAGFGDNVSARYSFVDDGAFGAHHIWESKVNNGFDLVTQGVMILSRGGYLGVGMLSPTERVEVNGNVKAQKFIGDGSQLTNLPIQPVILYSGTGQNVDGAMTQKATTNALALKANLNGGNAFTGNQSVQGEVSALGFRGDGSKLTNLSAVSVRNLGVTIVAQDGEQTLNVGLPVKALGSIQVQETLPNGDTATRIVFFGDMEFNTNAQTITLYDSANIKAGDKISGYFFY